MMDALDQEQLTEAGGQGGSQKPKQIKSTYKKSKTIIKGRDSFRTHSSSLSATPPTNKEATQNIPKTPKDNTTITKFFSPFPKPT